jgi:acetyl-CoA acetyltransferase
VCVCVCVNSVLYAVHGCPQVDLFEVNEAFAVVPMAVIADLNIPREKINAYGGACAVAHPIGR